MNIEITKEMIEAGIEALIQTVGGDRYQGHDDEVVKRIFIAMLTAMKKEEPPK